MLTCAEVTFRSASDRNQFCCGSGAPMVGPLLQLPQASATLPPRRPVSGGGCCGRGGLRR